ncbi:MAG: hypothetical protein U0L66_06340 [Acutalibacteraceae bacterium]|nr:hypothetical protein [Acutalibacteraceae bacterium]
MTMQKEGFTAQEVLRELVLNSLRSIEHYTRGWYNYDESKFLNGSCVGMIEQALEQLSIVKTGYLAVIQPFHLVDRAGEPIIQIFVGDTWRDIDMQNLCALFDVDYYTMVKLDN